jgi:outer membrane protein assembly factor BamD
MNTPLQLDRLSNLLLANCLLLLMLLAGCAKGGNLFSSPSLGADQPETAEHLVQKGLDAFNHAKYQSALDTFKKLKDRYPFSQYSLLAELKTADSQYFLKNYQEALLLYKEFEEQHPSNEAIAYVMFQTGMCHFNQIDSIDRDTTGATNAIQAFSRLLKTYPVSPYTKESQALIRAAKNFLAMHEFYVAEFYVKTKSYAEAEARLQYILDVYPETEVTPKAAALLAKLQNGTPPARTMKSWLPELSLPDWRIFGGTSE